MQVVNQEMMNRLNNRNWSSMTKSKPFFTQNCRETTTGEVARPRGDDYDSAERDCGATGQFAVDT